MMSLFQWPREATGFKSGQMLGYSGMSNIEASGDLSIRKIALVSEA
jgi:hypothetical protein